MATKTRKASADPKWLGAPLVVCLDGPLASRWYFQADWDRSVAAGRHMVERGQPRSVYLEYTATGADQDHPTYPTTGRALRWNRGRS